jgi:seryl-tRNA synthetase
MLDLQFLRDHPDRVRQAIRDKGAGPDAIVDQVLRVDDRRRAAQTELQEAQTELNATSKQIGEMMQTGRRDEAQGMIARSNELKQRVKILVDEPKRLEAEQRVLLLEIPNVPHESVPLGHSPEDNVVATTWGDQRSFDFDALPHWELAQKYGLIDFERGAKVAGAGFPFYLGAGARLQRALVHLFLDLAAEAGYTEIQAPHLVNEASGIGTGQLPDKEDLMYEVTRDRLYLIPTAEVPVTNYFRDEILSEADLPRKFVAYTPCFRREAGSYGKEVRGLNRLHQFDKVELVQFVRPEESYDALESLREDAERAVQRLGLPYRRLLMCTGDMGFTQSKKYDLEVWSAGQGRWLEVSSISNFEAYQARRANIRYRPDDAGRPQFVHTLNGSGLALPRIVAALLENNQQPDGSILIPDALRPYTGFDRIG